MSVLLHGDASFAAQGIVYETMDIAGLPNYTTGIFHPSTFLPSSCS